MKRCINPICGKEFRQLSGGDLYALETPLGDTHFLWLCSACALAFSVSLGPRGQPLVHPRLDHPGHTPPTPGNLLRLISHRGEATPSRHPRMQVEAMLTPLVPPEAASLAAAPGFTRLSQKAITAS